jgi:hypothetical protein
MSFVGLTRPDHKCGKEEESMEVVVGVVRS